MVDAAGKFVESVILTQPPAAIIGFCVIIRWLNVCGTVPAAERTVSSASGWTWPSKM